VISRTDAELDKLHQANAITVETLELLRRRVEPGMSTAELDRIAAGNLKRHGVPAAFKGYRGFPKSLCVSVNEEVVHGIPSRWRKLREGDVVSVDFGCIVDGYYGDNAMTIPVGEIAEEAARLLEVTEKAMLAGIGAALPGGRLSDIGHAVQTFVEERGFAIVREYGGHAIGTRLHMEPWIPNYGEPGKGVRLAAGDVMAIEPMVNSGGPEVMERRDGWTVVTADGSLSAHFERSIAITESGTWILCEERGTAAESQEATRVEGRRHIG